VRPETIAMIQTAIVKARVTRENVDDFIQTIRAPHQHREIKIGDVISHYLDDSGETEVTIWHNQRRAAVCYCHGESAWGDWDENRQTITLDEANWDGTPIKLDRYGKPRDREEHSR
jgi:hypothetical protein